MHNSNKLTLVILGWLMLFALQASAQTDSDEKVRINKMPLQDVGKEILNQWEKDDDVLKKSFTVELEGTLTKDGRIDAKKSKFTKSEGDEDIVNITKSAIEAIGDSGWFSYLYALGITDFNLTVSQNDEDFSVNVVSQQKSNEQARTIASGLNNLIMAAKMLKELGQDEIKLIKHSSATAEDSKFLLNFEMPKEIFQEMINRRLKEASERKKATNG